MKKPASGFIPAACLTAACCLLVTSASAEVKSFVIDATQSSLKLEGTALGSITMVAQPGTVNSLSTTYSGTIVADVTAASVAFVGGSAITANNSGNWQPGVGGVAGNAPANYGAFANAGFLGSGYAALRNLLFDLKSDSIPMLAGTFIADTLEFSFPPTATSTADYRVSGFLADSGSEALAGKSTNNILTAATITVVGAELVLTIPVDYTLVLTGDFDATFRVQGQLVGKAPNVTPLQIPPPVITPGQIGFTIPTIPGKTYTILGSAELTTPLAEWAVIDQFVATGASEARDIAITIAGQQFFILREE